MFTHLLPQLLLNSILLPSNFMAFGRLYLICYLMRENQSQLGKLDREDPSNNMPVLAAF